MSWHRGLLGGLTPAFILSALSAGCTVGVIDVDNDGRAWDKEASRLVTMTVPVTSEGAVQVTGMNGEIRVVAEPDAQAVNIRAIKRVRSDSFDDAECRLEEIEILVNAGGDRIRIRTVQPEQTGRRSYEVDYEIVVPAGFGAWVVDGNGQVELDGVGPGVGVEVGNGNVFLLGVEGSTGVILGNGNLEGSVFLPDGDQINCAVGNGSAVLSVQPDVSAELRAQVGNGTIVVTGLTISDPVTGPHLLQGRLGEGDGLIQLSVGNGNIRLKAW